MMYSMVDFPGTRCHSNTTFKVQVISKQTVMNHEGLIHSTMGRNVNYQATLSDIQH